MRVLLSAFFWIYLAVSLAIFWFAVAIPWVLSLPFDRRRRFAHWYACVWANHYIALSPFWEMRIEGLEHFRKDESYVIVANHQSIADIMVMFTTFRQFRWVSKHTVFYVPFMGWMMRMANYVGIRRGDRDSRKKMMNACRDHLQMGNSIMIFPEGTRSENREIKPFKRGAFQLRSTPTAPCCPSSSRGPTTSRRTRGSSSSRGNSCRSACCRRCRPPLSTMIPSASRTTSARSWWTSSRDARGRRGVD